MERLPYIAVLLAYSLIAVGHLLPGVAGERARKTSRTLAIAGALLHLGTLIAGVALGGRPGFPEALSAFSLGMMSAYAWVGTGRLRSLGMLLGPLAVVSLGLSLFVPPSSVAALDHAGRSPWLPIHLGLIFAGIAGFALSFAVGTTYLVVRYRLKQKRLAGLQRLPSLEVLDRINFRSMLFGFVFLTLGIAAGGAWAAVSLHTTWAFDPKVLFTGLIWLWYGVALQFRLIAGWRGRWAALFSIVGFGGLVTSMVLLRFVVEGWHSNG